jgi:hypothetical protein
MVSPGVPIRLTLPTLHNLQEKLPRLQKQPANKKKYHVWTHRHNENADAELREQETNPRNAEKKPKTATLSLQQEKAEQATKTKIKQDENPPENKNGPSTQNSQGSTLLLRSKEEHEARNRDTKFRTCKQKRWGKKKAYKSRKQVRARKGMISRRKKALCTRLEETKGSRMPETGTRERKTGTENRRKEL